MALSAFTVLTEFKFDIGAAVVNSEAVAGSVDKISTAANNAQFALARMSMSFMGSFLGGGGILSALALASKVSDDFTNSQISLANTLVMTGSSFEDRMLGAASVMEHLNNLAVKNSLSFKDLVNTTKMLTPMLLNKGLAGQDLRNVTEISRTFLKSAPTLGVDPQEAMGQLLRTMEGQASMGDNTLFVRLASETAPMKEFFSNTKKWNALHPAKRLQLLTAALKQFSDDVPAVSARVKTLSGQLAVLKNSIENLIRPIGAVLNKFFVDALRRINSPEVMGKAKQVFDSLAKIMSNFLVTPERMFADLSQLSKLSGHLKAAGAVVGIFASLEGIAFILRHLADFGYKVPFLTAGLVGLNKAIQFITTGPILGSAKWLLSGGIVGFFESLTIALSGIVMPLLLIIGVLQFLARSLAYAKLAALERIGQHMPRIMGALEIFSNLMAVLLDGFDLLAQAFGKFLDPTKFFFFIDLVAIFTSVLETMAGWLGRAMMGFQGVTLWVMEFVNQVGRLVSLQGFDPHAPDNAANFGMEEMYNRIFGKLQKGEGGVANQVTNIDKVEIKNNFKEMIEPDRVAFTIREQLLRANRNKTQASGQGMEAKGHN